MGYKLADGSLSTDYKIGDEFIIERDENGGAIGEKIKLEHDDNSDCPRFSEREDGGFHFYWRDVSAVKKPFTKSDLKDGMRVLFRDGTHCFLCGDWFIYNGPHRAWKVQAPLSEITDDLSDVDDDSDFDIIRVTDRDGTVLFEREGEPEKVKLELEVTPEQAEVIRKQLGW